MILDQRVASRGAAVQSPKVVNPAAVYCGDEDLPAARGLEADPPISVPGAMGVYVADFNGPRPVPSRHKAFRQDVRQPRIVPKIDFRVGETNFGKRVVREPNDSTPTNSQSERHNRVSPPNLDRPRVGTSGVIGKLDVIHNADVIPDY